MVCNTSNTRFRFRAIVVISFMVTATESCIYMEAQKLSCRKSLTSADYPLNVTTLEIREIDWFELNFKDLIARFPYVRNLTVVNGRNVSRLVAPPSGNVLKVLVLQNLRLKRIRKEFFRHLTLAEELDLRFNNLKNLPRQIDLPRIKKIYLNGNKWNCSLNLNWILDLNSSVVVDYNNLTCHDDVYLGKPVVEVARFTKEMTASCPRKCTCNLPKVVQELDTEVLEPIIVVNCSYRGFTKFPEILPLRTKTLYLQGNEIDSIHVLKTNPLYKNILDLYLDDNAISSIKELEGSEWLTKFRMLSLRGNKLTKIPTYAIDNALLQNSNMPSAIRLRLGDNPWRCDCPFTPVFQELLQKFAHQINDVREIKCSYVDGDENSLVPVIDLSRSSVCRFPTDYSVQLLDLINAILVFLIITVLAKLAYDYYHFKKTGRLPWIVTKMP